MSKTIVVYLQFNVDEDWCGRELFSDGTIIYAGYNVIPVQYSGKSEPDWDEIIVSKYSDDDSYNKAIERLKAEETKLKNYKVFLISLIPSTLFEKINLMLEKHKNFSFESLPEDDILISRMQSMISPKSLERYRSKKKSQPHAMVFFNKYHEVTEYPDDYSGEDKQQNGRAAYYEYAKTIIKYQGSVGGKILVGGSYKATISSDKDEAYDDFNVAWYPSLENFQKMNNAEEFRKKSIHRGVGLKDTLTCMTTPYEDYS